MKRRKLTRRGSKRLFAATANKGHKINMAPLTPVTRGGIRL